MKYIIKLSGLALLLIFSGCNDDFMERYPQDEVSNETFWKTEKDLETFINSIYDLTSSQQLSPGVSGLGITDILLGNARSNTAHRWQNGFKDFMSDDLGPFINNRTSGYIQFKTGTGTVPGSVWDKQNIGGWWWYLLRNINTFMDNYEKAELSDEIKNQYAAEVRLFRAWFYWDKVKKYGDVPLFTHALNIDDTEILFGSRAPREEAMDLIWDDINFACEHLPENWLNGNPGWMNKWSGLALKSRICLYEGTFRKYHGIGGSEEWLQAAADAAKKVMDSGKFFLYSTGKPSEDYRHSFYQKDLSNNPEIIYWIKYIDGINNHSATRYFGEFHGGATKDVVEDYLCTDGLPISLSTLYMGDDSIESVFVNRDPRMRQTILHPDDVGPDKPLHFLNGNTLAFPRFTGMSGGLKTTTGYYVIKFYNDEFWVNRNNNTVAAIVFRYGEVLLNYAEAKAELGTLLQGDLDVSINLLRDRIAMPHMSLSDLRVDPKYAYQGLSPVIQEIRRERRIELFDEGYRYDDLIRWKTAHDRLSKPTIGMLWDEAAKERYKGAVVKTIVDDKSGKTYIDVYQGTAYSPANFMDRDYLWPIPTWVLSENPNLGQNPGWE